MTKKLSPKLKKIIGFIAISAIVAVGANIYQNPDSVTTELKKINEILVSNGSSTDNDPLESREEILKDYDNRIADEFTIPENLKDRAGFWFDIYTTYDSNKKVIHHSEYPWIVFKVIDVSPIINSETPKIIWMRTAKAEKAVNKELKALQKAAQDLGRGKPLDPENEYQVLVLQALEKIQGSLTSKAKMAARSMRIQTGQKNFFTSGLQTSRLYLEEMENIFQKQKLPTELTRLPFVESSFNRHAVSKVGASGIWQFMNQTGKIFLTVNDHIDERNSPLKATVAAAKLLKENYIILKRSWPLAITAWNHGPTGIRKAMKAAKSEDLGKIISTYQSRSFDFASSNFYCEFLGALYAEKYHDQIFENIEYEKNLNLQKVKLARGLPARELLRRSGLSKSNFIFYNPDLKNALEKNAAIPTGFSLMVDGPTRLIMKNLISQERGTREKNKISRSDVSLDLRN